MVKAVLFDLDDTLYDTTQQVANARDNAVKAMVSAGLDVSYDKARKSLNKVVKSRGSNYGRHYDDLMAELGFGFDPKVVAAGVVAYHETKKAYLFPYPDTISTLLSLRDRGYSIGVVTDGLPVKQWEKLIRLGLSDFFHTVVVESEKERQKPSPKPFETACRNLGYEAEDCLMVGDRLDKDILGASRCGMQTVQYTKAGKAARIDVEPDYIITELFDLLQLVEGI